MSAALKSSLKYGGAAPAYHRAAEAQQGRHFTADRTMKPPPYPYKVDKLIKHQAKEYAGVYWEGVQRYNVPGSDKPFADPRSAEFRKAWPVQDLYVLWCWPLFVKEARKNLAKMLGQNRVDEKAKIAIHEALTAEFDKQAYEPEVARAMRGL